MRARCPVSDAEFVVCACACVPSTAASVAEPEEIVLSIPLAWSRKVGRVGADTGRHGEKIPLARPGKPPCRCYCMAVNVAAGSQRGEQSTGTTGFQTVETPLSSSLSHRPRGVSPARPSRMRREGLPRRGMMAVVRDLHCHRCLTTCSRTTHTLFDRSLPGTCFTSGPVGV